MNALPAAATVDIFGQLAIMLWRGRLADVFILAGDEVVDGAMCARELERRARRHEARDRGAFRTWYARWCARTIPARERDAKRAARRIARARKRGWLDG